MIAVRRACAADADEIVRLARRHAEFERSVADCKPAQLAEALDPSSPCLYAWLASADGAVLGYATATIDFSTWAGRRFLYLDCLFVVESARGGGIGRALMSALGAFGGEIGCRVMEWQTPSWNDAAIGFYRKLGATVDAKARFSIGIDELLRDRASES